MKYIKDSLKFVFKHNFRLHKNITVREIHAGKFPADMYIPEKSRGTILVIHGMSPLGNKDPRIINLSYSFAGTGYTVISPFYKKIASLKIDKSQIRDIINTIRAVAQDTALAPDGKIGLFSVSFSGGLSLVAAADPSCREMISSILIVGGYGDAKQTVEHIMKSENLDDYASMITFYNFIEYVTGKNPGLAKAFYLAAMDNSRNTDTLAPHLAKLSANDRNLFHRLKTDPAARLSYLEKLEKKAASRRILNYDLSPYPVLENIDAAVTFLHGKHDPVIPPEESQYMHEKLIRYAKPARLLLTPILSHGNVSLGFSRITAGKELAKTISFFFKHLRK